ncbi:DUF1634 domain-containing protein [Mucilaginibacter sp. P19]|uniref:DUF1634 domain-containing protein n=2 Tax=Mucilaginibacter TaxID=423349 RepID=A0AAE6JED9_9SPHI|nr:MULTISPECIES: DUF1634 domain-containing protein [Mucilaginibacter]QEM03743.1 DUF1634 domain-containing protein [Mucilaginibacter rubeus]QEM16354.1 DUF1634 domain-containing protein [Mucilaginibacter gossypii]QTE38544.1 DUF1634 domain-containing protein [Mucilaginibacter gossypii]QTE40878.1 DUF1634 domain-containing protein [Mucilaginibacter rubeus]QTE47481.1 DUF1634 domain-containing protein [Mucilaginibacter rubeus]
MDKFNKNNINQLIGGALRLGVFLSLIFMVAGGIGYLSSRSEEPAAFSAFRVSRLSFPAVFQGLLSFQSTAIINFGIMLLIATPVMRVVLALLSFVLAKDSLYTVITILVLLIILFSIISGHSS